MDKIDGLHDRSGEILKLKGSMVYMIDKPKVQAQYDSRNTIHMLDALVQSGIGFDKRGSKCGLIHIHPDGEIPRILERRLGIASESVPFHSDNQGGQDWILLFLGHIADGNRTLRVMPHDVSLKRIAQAICDKRLPLELLSK